MKTRGSIVSSLRFWHSVVVVIALAVCAGVPARAAENPNRHSSKVLAGFFEQWSIYYANYNLADLENNGSASRLSHLIYAFANVTTSPSVACWTPDPWADYQTPYLPAVGGIPDTPPLYGNFAELVKLKQLHPDLKVLISLGGANDANATAFSIASSTAAGRRALAASCIDMFITGNVGPGVTAPNLFDGFNIDWEFPTAADKHNFTLLLREFRRQMNVVGAQNGRKYVLTYDGPAGSWNFENIELAATARQVDFITIDGYNYSGAWDSTTNHASALFDSPQDPNYGVGFDINDTVTAYLNAGVPPKKYVMGLPLFGVGWSGVANVNNGLYQSFTGLSPIPPGDAYDSEGLATYKTLETLPAQGYQWFFDPTRIAVTLLDPTTQVFYSYDDPYTASLKMAYINSRVPGGLGGAFVWALKGDDASGTMVKTMAAGLGH